jgi:hypothetical protein
MRFAAGRKPIAATPSRQHGWESVSLLRFKGAAVRERLHPPDYRIRSNCWSSRLGEIGVAVPNS